MKALVPSVIHFRPHSKIFYNSKQNDACWRGELVVRANPSTFRWIDLCSLVPKSTHLRLVISRLTSWDFSEVFSSI